MTFMEVLELIFRSSWSSVLRVQGNVRKQLEGINEDGRDKPSFRRTKSPHSAIVTLKVGSTPIRQISMRILDSKLILFMFVSNNAHAEMRINGFSTPLLI